MQESGVTTADYSDLFLLQVQPVVPLHVTPVSLDIKAFLVFLCFLMSPLTKLHTYNFWLTFWFFTNCSVLSWPLGWPLFWDTLSATPLHCSVSLQAVRDADILKSSWVTWAMDHCTLSLFLLLCPLFGGLTTEAAGLKPPFHQLTYQSHRLRLA